MDSEEIDYEGFVDKVLHINDTHRNCGATRGRLGMRKICVDNDGRVLRKLVRLCLAIPDVSEVKGLTNELEALGWIRNNP